MRQAEKQAVTDDGFADRLLDWYYQYGRHDLPWQAERSLYRTWVSEIMLQQTQVATVIPYFQRFMQRFPDIHSLATASLDDVLLHWAGLGYYSRARNLHKAAIIINEQHQGMFPDLYEDVLALPGIGPSTAGAILAQALGQRHAILDGNVKRVLARYHAIEGWPGQLSVEKQLWYWAEQHTPGQRLADYTQAIMDLGATTCKRGRPACEACPFQTDCQAYLQDRVAELPTPRPKKQLPVRACRALLIQHTDHGWLLEQRPPAGIWGGLWCLPELDIADDIEQALQGWGLNVGNIEEMPVYRHTFSHFHLDMSPCVVQVKTQSRVAEPSGICWQRDLQSLALATPTQRLLTSVTDRPAKSMPAKA
jgi:A/G-specific adenine glycosylase